MSKQSSKIDIGSILNITLRLFIVCTIIAAVVAGVNALTADRIAENEQKIIDDTIRGVFSEGSIQKLDYTGETTVDSIYMIKSVSDDSVIGYSAICAPKGFGGEIRMLVAFDAEKNISAVRVMSHSETPGIGDKINKPEHSNFTEQFNGRNSELSFGNDGINKISGSSKSSNAVLKGVNDSIIAVSGIK